MVVVKGKKEKQMTKKVYEWERHTEEHKGQDFRLEGQVTLTGKKLDIHSMVYYLKRNSNKSRKTPIRFSFFV